MSTNSPDNSSDNHVPRDAPNWAQPRLHFEVGEVPPEAINLNVQGRQPLSPLQGFGQMWQKIYSVRLSGSEITPRELIATWKQRFPEFWPPGNRFYGPLTGIAPRIQWSEAKNLWHSSAIRSAFYTPVRLVRRLLRR